MELDKPSGDVNSSTAQISDFAETSSSSNPTSGFMRKSVACFSINCFSLKKTSNSLVDLPTWRRAVNCLCGVETQKASQAPAVQPTVDPQLEAIIASDFIKEDPKWSR